MNPRNTFGRAILITLLLCLSSAYAQQPAAPKAPAGETSPVAAAPAPRDGDEGGETKKQDRQDERLDATTTLIMGIMGMLGVFSGLILLALALIGLRKTIVRFGLDGTAPPKKPAPRDPPDAPACTPAEATAAMPEPPAPAPPATRPPAPVETGPAEGWRLAGSAMNRPSTSQWLRPAFRAAFQGAAPAGETVEIQVGDRTYAVEILSLDGDRAKVRVNHRDVTLELDRVSEGAAPIPAAPAPAARPVQTLPKAAPAASTPKAASAPPKPQGTPEGTVAVRAPIPGTILKLIAKGGTTVKRGEVIFILEAMKMENEVCSPVSGMVKDIKTHEGAAVRQGDVLALVEPD